MKNQKFFAKTHRAVSTFKTIPVNTPKIDVKSGYCADLSTTLKTFGNISYRRHSRTPTPIIIIIIITATMISTRVTVMVFLFVSSEQFVFISLSTATYTTNDVIKEAKRKSARRHHFIALLTPRRGNDNIINCVRHHY